MATMVAIRFNPLIKGYYLGLIGRGKAKKIAIVACMREVIVILNAMVRGKRVFKEGEHADDPKSQTNH